MPTFELVVHTSDKMLPHILQALEGHATLRSVMPVPNDPNEPKPPAPPAAPMPSVQLSLPTDPQVRSKRPYRYAGGRHNKGIRGIDLCIDVLTKAGCPLERGAFFKAFGEHGFAENSASPAISNCLSAGTIIQVKDGLYALPPPNGPAA